jgi:MFS family permease
LEGKSVGEIISRKLIYRLVVGMSSGLAVCLVPPFLSIIARSTPQLASKTGLIGTMNQIGIVTGLFFGQVAGLILTGSVSYPWTIPADGRKETFPEDGDT